ncbi:MAG: addiction module protein [Bacteroidales bacterium]|nr:addiction module protein [Bacteroidales bacterium]
MKSLNLFKERELTMNKIKDTLKLSVEERIQLVQSIWDSVAAEAEA